MNTNTVLSLSLSAFDLAGKLVYLLSANHGQANMPAKRHASCDMLSCQETSVSFDNQDYLSSKRCKLHSLCTQLYFATKDGVGFSGRLWCCTKRNPRNSRSRGGGLPLYILHPVTLSPPQKRLP